MDDEAIQVAAKKNITDNLKSAVQLLQRRYVCSDTPIYSDDTANAVCNIVEAIFLHQLKSSVSRKLSNYFSGTDVTPQATFWQFLVKFSHRDVLSQLNHLGQITTHIGLCRAWIRLALNDGVLESYMDAILDDKETLRHFYKRTAYLRDAEHPLIMKTYIQGLNSFQFALSYNSSVLNVWTSTPLALAGCLFTPPPVITATSALPDEEEVEDVVDTEADHIVVPRRLGTSRIRPPSTPHNTPIAGLSRANIDEIRSSLRGFTPGSGSSTPTSQVSHPDPVDARIHSTPTWLEEEVAPNDSEQVLMSDDKTDVCSDHTASTDQVDTETDHTTNERSFPDQTYVVTTTEDVSSIVTKTASLLHLSASSPGKSEVLLPELSDVTASCDSNEVANEDKAGEEEEDEEPQFGGGNSLGMMQGWSSEFQTDQRMDEALVDAVDCLEGLQDSFGSLLQNYGPTSKPLDVPTMGEVLNTLPDSGYRTQRPDTIEVIVGQEVDQGDNDVSETATDSQLLLPTVEPLVAIIGDICNERGLDVQNYQCKACSRPIGIFYGKARVCTYDACYYCYECHENDEYYIPARILHNWDFRKHKVCRQNMQLLQQLQDQALIDVETKNPRLYDHVTAMSTVKDLRMQLRLLKAYLFTCKQDVADSFRQQFASYDHLYESIHLYSLNDFLQVHSGQLAQTLSKAIRQATAHVYQCALCQQKGFICEICNSAKVIYPFQSANIYRCLRCQAVYHSECKANINCPKCERRRSRHHGNHLDDENDYAYSP